MFKIRFLISWKCFKPTWNSLARWISSKINSRDKTFLCCHYCWLLLRSNYWRSLMLWNAASWSGLKVIVQIQVAPHPCDPFLVNSDNMTGNSLEKHYFVVFNVKLQVKLRFKIFYWLLKLLPTTCVINTTTNTDCVS